MSFNDDIREALKVIQTARTTSPRESIDDSMDLIIAALLLKVYGEDDLSTQVQKVALRVNDGLKRVDQ